jgi:hypothetical protein
MNDLHNNLYGTPTINPGVKTAAVTGSSVDLQGYDGAEIVINVGTRTDSTFVTNLQESDDASTWSDVAAADMIGTEPTISGTSNTVYQLGYKGSKRYVRLNSGFVAGGASAGAAFGAVVIRGLKRHNTGA